MLPSALSILFPVKHRFRELALAYAKALDLYGPAVQKAFDLHYDSAKAFAHFIPESAQVLDVGSGGGLPAIPLAIERPDLRIWLCEIRDRRSTFLKLAVAQLGLKNAQVFAGDVRAFPHKVSWVTALAVGDLEHLIDLLRGVTDPEWHLVIRRSHSWYAPSVLKGHQLVCERHSLDSETDIIHITFRREH